MARHSALIAAVAAVVAVGLLSACGSGGDGKPAVKPTPTISKGSKFLSAVSSADIDRSNWQGGEPTDKQLTDLPPKWCKAAEQGHTVKWMLSGSPLDVDSLYPNGPSWGTQRDDAQTLVVLGVTAYCPEYRKEVIDGLRADGLY